MRCIADLEPWDTERLAVGAEARRGPENSADWHMRNLHECTDGEEENCIERTAGDITLHAGYANVVETELSGINTRLGGGRPAGKSWACVPLGGTSPAPNGASRAKKTSFPSPRTSPASASLRGAAA